MTLAQSASLIRSKNAGPFCLTFDVMFRDVAEYRRVKATGALSPELIARVYLCPVETVRLFYCDNALAIKVTIPRRRAQGDFGDADLHGCQQHAPLMALEVR